MNKNEKTTFYITHIGDNIVTGYKDQGYDAPKGSLLRVEGTNEHGRLFVNSTKQEKKFNRFAVDPTKWESILEIEFKLLLPVLLENRIAFKSSALWPWYLTLKKNSRVVWLHSNKYYETTIQEKIDTSKGLLFKVKKETTINMFNTFEVSIEVLYPIDEHPLSHVEVREPPSGNSNRVVMGGSQSSYTIAISNDRTVSDNRNTGQGYSQDAQKTRQGHSQDISRGACQSSGQEMVYLFGCPVPLEYLMKLEPVKDSGYIDDSVIFNLQNEGPFKGIVRYVGRYASLCCYGIALKDGAIDGATNGEFYNRSLFQCKRGRGILVTEELFQRILEETRYHRAAAAEAASNRSQTNLPGRSKSQASINTPEYESEHAQNIRNEEMLKKQQGQFGGMVNLFGWTTSLDDMLQLKFTSEDNNYIDELVEFSLPDHGELTGIVRYVGTYKELCFLGITLDNSLDEGTDGKFYNHRLFQCKPGHGILLPKSNVRIIERKMVTLFGWTAPLDVLMNLQPANEAKEYIDEPVSFNLLNHGELKGTVRYIGINDEFYFIGIALEQPIEEGTDGEFFSRRLFQCKSGCGILLPKTRVTRINKQMVTLFGWTAPLDVLMNLQPTNEDYEYIDEPVTFNSLDYGELKGTVRYVGIHKQFCFLGIVLKHAIKDGTDGEFVNHRLFQCKSGYGILLPKDNVVKIEKEMLTLFGWTAPSKVMMNLQPSKIYNKYIDETIEFDLSAEHLKGVVRYVGTYENFCFFGIVLEQSIEDGTDGKFFNRRLFQCKSGCGILLPKSNLKIFQTVTQQPCSNYSQSAAGIATGSQPKHKPELPPPKPKNEWKGVLLFDGNHIFNEDTVLKLESKRPPKGRWPILDTLGMDHAVEFTMKRFGVEDEIYHGSIKWMGLEVTPGQKPFAWIGVEVDNHITFGTNGTFLGKQLFTCQDNHGFMVPGELIRPDARFDFGDKFEDRGEQSQPSA